MIKKKTHKIIELLTEGKTQTEIANMGYPFGTVRYHYQKMFHPKKFERFMSKHKARIRQRRKVRNEQELSTKTKAKR